MERKQKPTKNGIPVQEYELINVARQTIEDGTPLICDDCGRVIFNIATIKGKKDGMTYNVGLTCVKKLLNKTIYFNYETMIDYEREVCEWNSAFNTRKWVEKIIAKAEPGYYGKPQLRTWKSREDGAEYCYIELPIIKGVYPYDTTKSHPIKYRSAFEGLCG